MDVLAEPGRTGCCISHSRQEKQVLFVVIVSSYVCLCPKWFLDVPAHNPDLLGLQSITHVALF